ncbi:MAG: hypothetical protein WD342_15695 [Verrucomicrobiales bacterium]
MKLRAAGLAALLSVGGSAAGQDGASAVVGIVDQREYQDSINGCAPASILNLLKFSDTEYRNVYHALVGATDGVRLRFVVDRYFKNRLSVVYPNQKRWTVHGIQSTDLATGLNELLAEHGLDALNATHLDLAEGESEADHLRRCHGLVSASIENGVSPILGLRSFVVRRRESRDGRPAWESGVYHNVVVDAITRPPSETGFEISVLDPYRGKATAVYLHPQAGDHPFRALKGSRQKGEWLDGTPFLQVLAPDLPTVRPLDVKWSDRIVVLADFLIGDF